MSASPSDTWSHTLALAGESLEPLVREALESLGHARWGEQDTGHWRVLSNPERATWVLAKFIAIDADSNYRYERIEIVATVDPKGQLVTWQITNGAEFLGLTDLTAYGLQRGVVHLLDQEYREWVTADPLFVEANARSLSLRGIWLKVRGKLTRG